MTAAQAATAIQITEGHVRKLCAAGALDCERIGARVWLIAADSVSAFRASPQRQGWPRGKSRRKPEPPAA